VPVPPPIIMSLDNPATFTERFSRSDALYFTITIFSTVGFGDITTPQGQRRVSSWQFRRCWIC
jgi:voltage-gated potassium channel